MKTLVRAMVVVGFVSSSPATAQTDSNHADGLRKAMDLHDAGRYREAIEEYRALLQQKPNDLVLLYEISVSYQALRDYPHCIDYARRAGAIRGAA